MSKPKWWRNVGLWWQRVTTRWRLRRWFAHRRCAVCCGWESSSGMEFTQAAKPGAARLRRTGGKPARRSPGPGEAT